jgi:hypothetical protein
MADTMKTIGSVLLELESLQRQVGEVQAALLDILTDETQDEWDEVAQSALVKLENVQRSIGEVQVALLRQVRTELDKPEDVAIGVIHDDEVPRGERSEAEAKEAPSTPVWTDPKQWLEKRNIQVKSVRVVSGIDPAADRAALFLGEHFAPLEPFYEAIKRRVSGGSKQKWFSVQGLPGTTIHDICQFAAMLHASAFLSEFKYVKRNQTVLFIPLDDGRVYNFFTGGWMERYTLHLVKQAVERSPGTWSDEQALPGAQVLLPDGTDAELDLLVGLSGGRVLWLECKTGDWQTYVTRFQSLNKRFIHLPPEQAALVLLDRLTAEQKASASALTAMTVLHLTELSDWLAKAVHG